MAAPLIISTIGGLLKTWLGNRAEVAKAKHERKVQMISRDQSWEELAMANSGASWKDEYLTLLFSVPLILCFFPQMVDHVRAGFDALELMPEWYRYSLSVIVAASFGVRSAIGWKRASLSQEVVKNRVIDRVEELED